MTKASAAWPNVGAGNGWTTPGLLLPQEMRTGQERNHGSASQARRAPELWPGSIAAGNPAFPAATLAVRILPGAGGTSRYQCLMPGASPI